MIYRNFFIKSAFQRKIMFSYFFHTILTIPNGNGGNCSGYRGKPKRQLKKKSDVFIQCFIAFFHQILISTKTKFSKMSVFFQRNCNIFWKTCPSIRRNLAKKVWRPSAWIRLKIRPDNSSGIRSSESTSQTW